MRPATYQNRSSGGTVKQWLWHWVSCRHLDTPKANFTAMGPLIFRTQLFLDAAQHHLQPSCTHGIDTVQFAPYEPPASLVPVVSKRLSGISLDSVNENGCYTENVGLKNNSRQKALPAATTARLRCRFLISKTPCTVQLLLHQSETYSLYQTLFSIALPAYQFHSCTDRGFPHHHPDLLLCLLLTIEIYFSLTPFN